MPAGLNHGELRRLSHLASRMRARTSLQLPGRQASQRRPGSGSEFLDHVEYTWGTDVRHVDWRASARRATPLLRRSGEESGADWTICIDASASMNGIAQRKWLLAVRLAAAFAWLLLDTGNRVSLIAFSSGVDARVGAGRGRAQYARIARFLQSTAPRSSGGASQPGQCASLMRQGDAGIVIGDFLRADAMRTDLSVLAHGTSALHVLQVADREELAALTLPARLRDAESGAEIVVDAAAGAQGLHAFERLQATLRALCVAAGIHCSSADVGQAWSAIVTRHLLAVTAHGHR